MLGSHHQNPGRALPVLLVCCLASSLCLGAEAGEGDPASLARQILAETNVKGGVIVHVGCGDGRLTAALGAGESYLIQGLDTEPENVARARSRIQKLGDYGRVSVDVWDGTHLPYVDNFVNLIVADSAGELSLEEVTRALCPNGVAMVKESGGRVDALDGPKVEIGGVTWCKTIKPWPEGIDQWTHFLHGPDNNAVAHDRVVGPPRRMQWLGGPRYSRHHDKMSSVSAVVSAAGRVFYIIDEAPDVSILTAPKWNLVARDAFNGTILWRRPVGPWHSHMHGLKSGPADLPRRLVAVGQRVYVTLGLGEPLTALDAATGQTVHTYRQTDNAEEIVCSEGVLFVQVGSPTPLSPAGSRRKGKPAPPGDSPKTLLAIEADSGQILWTAEEPMLKGTLAADQRRVVFMSIDRVVCLDRRDGRELWRSEPLPRAEQYPLRFTPTLVLHGDLALFAGGEFAANGNRSWATGKDDTLTALSATTGETLWKAPHPLSGYASAEDLLVTNGIVWAGETTSGHAVGRFTGRDVATGKVIAEFDPDVDTYWFHHRCHRGKATDKYLLTSRTGTEFIDVETHHWQIHHWVRGACLYGVMPANGLLYAPPHPCACFLEAKTIGFSALAAQAAESQTPKADATPRLVRGPAYDDQFLRLSDSASAGEDWPTYRHDPARSGRATTNVPAGLEQAWTADLGPRLTSPVIAGGRVFLASVDAHTVHALDAASGKPLWQHTAGGRVDSPPTCWQGRILFGSADGRVTCLRASDGALAWRFRAAPIDRRLAAFGQIESVWPVHGSVLVYDDVLWFACGRSMFLDGGIRLFRLDPRTGRVLLETVMDDRDTAGGKQLQDYARQHNMPVALPDVLSCDGRLVYMRSQPFELDGTRLPLEALPYAGNPERYSVPPTQRPDHAHLFSPTGFLDDTWWHRTYWVYGSRFLGGWAGYSQAGKVAPAGKILVFDDSNVYGYGRKPQYYRWTTPIEHHLFRADKDPQNVPPDGQGKHKPGGSRSGRVAHRWSQDVPLFARAMVLSEDTLFFAGPADLVDESAAVKRLADPQTQAQIREQEEAFRGLKGGTLWAVSSQSGEKLSEVPLETIPVFDGMAAAGGRLYLAGVDGRVTCFKGE
ncbi:MAG: outer membrane protein assembly factor BamB family protein [Planctomycetota bacterium]|jgi:outer membrane protein assembly factor BamB